MDINKRAEDLATAYALRQNDSYNYWRLVAAVKYGYMMGQRDAENGNCKPAPTPLEEKKAYLQEHCPHDWGGVEWTWSCGGYRTCRICGKTEDYYERD